MVHRIKRSERGYRVGEDHQNARAADAAVRLARDLHEFSRLMPAAIVRRLLLDLGVAVPHKTVEQWIYYRRRNVTPREREERQPTHRTIR